MESNKLKINYTKVTKMLHGATFICSSALCHMCIESLVTSSFRTENLSYVRVFTPSVPNVKEHSRFLWTFRNLFGL